MAVHDECKRTRVAAKFLPIHKVPEQTTTVPADFVTLPDTGSGGVISAFTVDEGAITRLIEFWVEFSLTPQQVEQEMQIEHAHRGHSTAVTLATRAANLLTQAEDMIVFQGATAFGTSFFQNNIRSRGVPVDFGLLDIVPDSPPAGSPPPLPEEQVIPVQEIGSPPAQFEWGENTFKAVAQGYATLQGKGQYGPYALVLHTVPYADTHAPLASTLIMPADRIMSLMTGGFFGSGTLVSGAGASPPEEPFFTGSLVSTGGNTMDLVVGIDATTAFHQVDPDGIYRFRVLERLALRLKDLSAVIRLEFQ
jgi:uncharacterized linocin/CFP29 family protein